MDNKIVFTAEEVEEIVFKIVDSVVTDIIKEYLNRHLHQSMQKVIDERGKEKVQFNITIDPEK